MEMNFFSPSSHCFLSLRTALPTGRVTWTAKGGSRLSEHPRSGRHWPPDRAAPETGQCQRWAVCIWGFLSHSSLNYRKLVRSKFTHCKERRNNQHISSSLNFHPFFTLKGWFQTKFRFSMEISKFALSFDLYILWISYSKSKLYLPLVFEV